MRKDVSENRKESRLLIEAGTIVEVLSEGRPVRATTIDMSASGVLLEFEEPVEMAVGDLVTCDFVVSHGVDEPLPYWGIGKVVRVTGNHVALNLNATGLVPLDSKDAVTSR